MARVLAAGRGNGCWQDWCGQGVRRERDNRGEKLGPDGGAAMHEDLGGWQDVWRARHLLGA